MPYKKSKYNLLIESINGGVLIFNSLSSAIVWIPDEMWKQDLFCGKIEGMWSEVIDAGIWIDADKDEFAELEKCLIDSMTAKLDDVGIVIAPTYACNMKCDYCFQHDECERVMSYDVADKVFDSIAEVISRYKVVTVSWFGGEPLLATNIIEYLSNKLIEYCDAHKMIYRSDIITNGTLLTEDCAKLLQRCRISNVQITLDGINHDKARKMKDGSSSYKIIADNIASAASKFNIVVRSNITDNNILDVQKMIDELMVDYNLAGKISFSFYPVSKFEGKTPKGIGFHHFCNTHTYDSSLVNLINHVAKYQSIQSVSNTSFLPSALPCQAVLKDTICLDAYGDVYKCMLAMQNTDMKIGNILQRPIAEILGDGDQKGWLSFKWDNECKECQLLPLCHSGCIFEKKASNLKRLCSLNKMTYKEVVKLIYEDYVSPQTTD